MTQLRVEIIPCAQMTAEDERAIARLCAAAWPDPADPFSADDLAHAHGGTHLVVRDARGAIRSHAAIVPRRIWVGEVPLPAGYLEAVATDPVHRGRGYASAILARAGERIRTGDDLGLLSGEGRSLYRRHGWEPWTGPSLVRGPGGVRPTPGEDGGIQLLRTDRVRWVRGDEPIACEERAGDPW